MDLEEIRAKLISFGFKRVPEIVEEFPDVRIYRYSANGPVTYGGFSESDLYYSYEDGVVLLFQAAAYGSLYLALRYYKNNYFYAVNKCVLRFNTGEELFDYLECE